MLEFRKLSTFNKEVPVYEAPISPSEEGSCLPKKLYERKVFIAGNKKFKANSWEKDGGRHTQEEVEKVRLANVDTNPLGLGISFTELIPPTSPHFSRTRPPFSFKNAFRELWQVLRS